MVKDLAGTEYKTYPWEIGGMYKYVQQHVSGTYSKRLKAYRNITDIEPSPTRTEPHSMEKSLRRAGQSPSMQTRVKFRDGEYNFMLLELNVPFTGRQALYTKFLYSGRLLWVPDVDNYVCQMMKL